MKNINTMSELENEIAVLRQRQQQDLSALKSQYHVTVENLQPVNLVKNALHDVLTAPDLKSNLIKAAIGFGTTYLSKTLYSENSANPIKRILTQAVKYGINYFANRRQQNGIAQMPSNTSRIAQ